MGTTYSIFLDKASLQIGQPLKKYVNDVHVKLNNAATYKHTSKLHRKE